MTLNTLFFKRLKIFTNDGKVAYDENFHKGVNIIRGDNSSGKSTITHFIFYVLGGAFSEWTDEAKQCSDVLAEIEINNVTMTVKRFVSDSTNQPMYIYWGSMRDAVKATIEGQWHKYSYKSSDDKMSFSNMMFENLNIPIVYGDNNITMHQLLRLMYVDQESPTSSLFYYEQFDSGFTRQTVADLLLGVYDSSLYNDRLDRRDAEKKVAGIEGEIKGMKKIYNDLRSLDKNHIGNLIENTKQEKNAVESEIIKLRENKKRVNFRTDSKLNFQKLNDEVVLQRRKIKKYEDSINKAEHEINDSDFFIETLETKKNAIEKSLATRTYFQNFPFQYCPECLSELELAEVGHCKLCKQKISDKDNGVIAKRMLQEISFQIIESKKLKESKVEQLRNDKAEYESQDLRLNQLQKQVNSALKDVKSFKDEKVDELLIKKGEYEGLLMQYLTMLEIAEKYDLLLSEKYSLDKKIAFLKDSIKTKEFNQDSLKIDINNKVEAFALNLLKNDLNREDGFREAKNLRINYYDNSIYIDDEKKKFSASSNFYLKNTARFSLFFASLSISKMRYPRFILCDNMEDKGIEKERAQNFQKLIIETAKNSTNEDFQIIYTTSYIPEELDNDTYCVGDFYSGETNRKSLDNIKKK